MIVKVVLGQILNSQNYTVCIFLKSGYKKALIGSNKINNNHKDLLLFFLKSFFIIEIKE
ncbi:MAG: hypothetical protein PHV52_08440 [Aliarcobacter sp.]|nr:hypothetical protein [Aliarcobacter sp.]